MRWSRHVDDGGRRTEDPVDAPVDHHGPWGDPGPAVDYEPPQKLLRPVGHAPRRRHDTGAVPTLPATPTFPGRSSPGLGTSGRPPLGTSPDGAATAGPPTSTGLPPARVAPPAGQSRRPLPTPPRGEPRLSLPPSVGTAPTPLASPPTQGPPGARRTPAGGLPRLPETLAPEARLGTTLPAPTGPARTARPARPTPTGGTPRVPAPAPAPAPTSRPTPAGGQPRVEVPRTNPVDEHGEAQAREVELAFGDKPRLLSLRRGSRRSKKSTSSPAPTPSPSPAEERRRFRVEDDVRAAHAGHEAPAPAPDALVGVTGRPAGPGHAPTGVDGHHERRPTTGSTPIVPGLGDASPTARRRAERERERALGLSSPGAADIDAPAGADDDRRGRPGRGLLALVAAAVVGALVALGAFVVLTRDSGPSDDELLDVVVQSTITRTNGVVTQVEAECMAEAVVRSVGRERLAELGALDGADALGALSPAERNLAVPRAFDCLDDQRLLDVFVATWPADGVSGLGSEVAPCVYQGWWDGMGRESVVHLFASFLAPTPPPLDETLEPNELAVATRVLSECQTTP